MDEDDKGTGDDAILKEARQRYRLCADADSDDNKAALDDLRFLQGGENQWDERAVQTRKAQQRPIITVNTLPTYLHQVTNDQRMNSPSIKVHPVDDGADVETAKIRQGLIRHIEYDSNADVAYDRAVNSAAAIGKGFWYLFPEYESEDSFNQKLVIKSIRNALSVKIDPLSTEPDGSDMQYAFIESLMDKGEFKRQYPNASANNSGLFSDGTADYAQWITDTSVLVCEYFYIDKTEATVVQLSDGDTGFKDELNMDAISVQGVSIVKERKGARSKVMWCKITAVDVLERTEIKCKWIPVFPVYGDEIDIEGKVTRAGIIRNAKGPAQSYNVMMTAATEEVAARTKSPYIMAEGQDEGWEDEWDTSATVMRATLHYKPVALGDKLAPPPQRQPMADVPTGMLAMAMHSKDNIKATTGLFDSSLGAKGTATSGIQEREQQQQGDMANFHYADGLNRTLRHEGRCINWMLPYYYDAERTVRILGEDDTAEYATINQQLDPPQVDEKTGAVKTVLNDMSGGEYDVTVTSGPSYSTLRQESAEAMGNIMAKNPAAWAVFGDLYVKSQDWPNADKIAARVKKTIPPNLLENEEESEDAPPQVIQTPQGPLPVAQVPQMLAELQGQLQQTSEALQKAQADKQQSEVMKQQNAQGSLALDAERLKIEQFNAETERFKAEADAQKAEADRAKSEAELLLTHQQIQIDGKMAELEAINGDTTAFDAWKATLESDTKIMVANIMARSAERKTAMSAQSALEKASISSKKKETQ